MTGILARLKPFPGSRHRRKRLGDGSGSGHGQTCTRGQKGQRSRAGDGKLVGFEGGQTPLLRRLPKRGFSNAAFRVRPQIVSLDDIERVFANQREVGLEALRLHRLVKGKGCVKVLAGGRPLKRALTVRAHAFSRGARARLAEAGGEAVIQAP